MVWLHGEKTPVFSQMKAWRFHQNDPTFLASRGWSVEKPPRCELIDCKSETACAWIIRVIGIIPKNFQILKLWIFGRFEVAYLVADWQIDNFRGTWIEAILEAHELMAARLHGYQKLPAGDKERRVTHATSAQRVAVTQYLGAL